MQEPKLANQSFWEFMHLRIDSQVLTSLYISKSNSTVGRISSFPSNQTGVIVLPPQPPQLDGFQFIEFFI